MNCSEIKVPLLREDDRKQLESLATGHAGALNPSHYAEQCYAEDFDILRNVNICIIHIFFSSSEVAFASPSPIYQYRENIS
jgi:hypothetical protein